MKKTENSSQKPPAHTLRDSDRVAFAGQRHGYRVRRAHQILRLK